MDSGSVRGLPSLDEDLQRLRPDGYQSAELDGDNADRQLPVETVSVPPRIFQLPVQVVSMSTVRAVAPALATDADDTLSATSRPISAISRPYSETSFTSRAQYDRQQSRLPRRVHIQLGSDDEDGGGGCMDGGEDSGRPSPGRLPGQVPSHSFSAGQQQGGSTAGCAAASGGDGSGASHGGHRSHIHHPPLLSPPPGGGGAGGGPAPWASLGRSSTLSPLTAMPPDSMPQLHQATWFNDLDTLLDLLKNSPDPLKGLVWYNPKLYPEHYNTAAVATAVPQLANMESATAALKVLLAREYLTHACHPLTIAAANGNERIVDELLKAMLEEAGRRPLAGAMLAMSWREPPPELPPGCPWVTPLAAAALAGSGECVRLIAQAARRRSLVEDRSTYGCFRFRPLTVAQTADAVHSLFRYGCCPPDTIRYRLCDAARRLAKRESAFTAALAVQPQRHKAFHERQQQQDSKGDKNQKPPGDDVDAVTNEGSPPADSANALPRSGILRDAGRGSFGVTGSVQPFQDSSATAITAAPAFAAAGGGGGRSLPSAMSSLPQSSVASPRNQGSAADTASVAFSASRDGTGAGSAGALLKAAELMLFRARLFHDSLGRPLGRSLCEFLPETLVALAALAAMVEQGLQPDRFLSHAEHANITSTSLLMVLVRNYHTALRSAAGGGGAAASAAAYGSMRGSASDAGAAYGSMRGGPSATPAASSASATVAATAMAAAQVAAAATDLSSAAREALDTLAAGLLAHGAVVDDPPREGCRHVGGFHVAPAHGPEAPLHHAFIHGPQELVVMLLQYSEIHPEPMEELVTAAAATPAADVGGGGALAELDARAAAAKSLYSRRPGGGQPPAPAGSPQQQQKSHHHRRHHPGHKEQQQHSQEKMQSPRASLLRPRGAGRGSVPWAGGRSSPLLAFGAKMQSALLDGNVPLWLHSGRFAELMEALIKSSIEAEARSVTCDLTWLVVELFERGMAHEFENLAAQLRLADSGSFSGEDAASRHADDGGAGVGSSKNGRSGGEVVEVLQLRGGLSASASGRRSGGGGPTPISSGAADPTLPDLSAPRDAVITVDSVMPASPCGESVATDDAKPPSDAKPRVEDAFATTAIVVAASGDKGGVAAAAGGGGGAVGVWGTRRHRVRHADEGDSDGGGSAVSRSSRSSSASSRASSSAGSSLSGSDIDDELVSGPAPWRRKSNAQPHGALSSPEDSMTLSIVHSLYRNTADAITSLHQALGSASLEAGSLAGIAAGGGGGSSAAAVAGALQGVGGGGAIAAAALVDWTALLRLVARIAATTLNPPKSHGAVAGNISVFTTAKAVNQLLYARDWARGGGGGVAAGAEGAGGGAAADAARRAASVVDIDLLRAIARRHPHEAARLIHGMDLMRVELKGYRWDSIPMSLDQDCYAVMTAGEPVKLSNRPPTVAPASVAAAAAAAEEKRRRAAAAADADACGGKPKLRMKGVRGGGAGGKGKSAAVAAEGAITAAGTAATAAAAAVDGDPLTREDILQACIFSNMWSVLTHFLLSSTRLPAYMRPMQRLRNATYRYAVMGQLTQYGSIPVVLGVGFLLVLLGLLARGLQRTVRLVGNLVLAGYGRLEEQLQPAMSNVGRRLQLDKVQRRVGRLVRRAAGGVGVVGGVVGRASGVGSRSAALLNVGRAIPHYLSFLGVLLDPDALAEVWLGVTQHYSRSTRAKLGATGGDGGAAAAAAAAGGDGDGGNGGDGAGAGGGGGVSGGGGGGPAYMSRWTTRVVCSRVPLACAAAMPSALLYTLASSPQVNGELFASPVMRAVIVWRWQHFTRYFLLLQFLEHLLYMAFFMVYAFSLSYSPQMLTRLLGASRTAVWDVAGCSLPPSGLQKFLLVSLGVMTITCIMQELRQLMFFKLGWLRQPWNLMDLASSTIVTTIVTLHLSCNTDPEWLRGLAAVEVALLFMRLLYFAMADDRLGSFFRMVIEVLRDCWLFFVFLGILFVGWGLALTVMQGQSTTVQDTYLQLFTMIFGDFQLGLLLSADAGSRGLDNLWRMFTSVYQILVTIILLNLLIAIINDSYERINDNEACESLRNKLTLIVEAESVMPASMARRMLESLASTDLYVITAEAATVSAGYDEGGGGGADGRTGAASSTTRRPLAPPARWSGRMGETKRFVSHVADQLLAQQAAFQSRLLALLALRTAGHTAGAMADAMPSGLSLGLGGGRDASGGLASGLRGAAVTSKHLSGLPAASGGSGLGPVGLGRGGGAAAPVVASQGSLVVDAMADVEAFADVMALGRLLRDKLEELKQEQEESRQRHETEAVALQEGLRAVVEGVGWQVAALGQRLGQLEQAVGAEAAALRREAAAAFGEGRGGGGRAAGGGGGRLVRRAGEQRRRRGVRVQTR